MPDTDSEYPILILTGPTAIGKTELSLEIAETFNCEIVSVDSMQIYKYMDIGTAKATVEERERVKHHLIDIISPDEEYDVSRFIEDCTDALQKIWKKNKLPLLTGGTGLYYTSLIEGLFPDLPSDHIIREKLLARLRQEGRDILHEELRSYDYISAERIHKNDTHRLIRALEIFHASGVPWSTHLARHKATKKPKMFRNVLGICLTEEREGLYERINLRCEQMLSAGLRAEVQQLLDMGYHANLKPMQAIGYKHMLKNLSGQWNSAQTKEFLARDTRRYAKRQFTWFKKMDYLSMVDRTHQEEILHKIDKWYSGDKH